MHVTSARGTARVAVEAREIEKQAAAAARVAVEAREIEKQRQQRQRQQQGVKLLEILIIHLKVRNAIANPAATKFEGTEGFSGSVG